MIVEAPNELVCSLKKSSIRVFSAKKEKDLYLLLGTNRLFNPCWSQGGDLREIKRAVSSRIFVWFSNQDIWYGVWYSHRGRRMCFSGQSGVGLGEESYFSTEPRISIFKKFLNDHLYFGLWPQETSEHAHSFPRCLGAPLGRSLRVLIWGMARNSLTVKTH